MRSGGSFGNCADFENGSAAADDDDDDTFKARMEKLSDKSSTNLYFEGLGFFLSFFLFFLLFGCGLTGFFFVGSRWVSTSLFVSLLLGLC
jgi:hypothetical protein